MSVRDTVRGYVVQALILLIDALTGEAIWEAVSIEPEDASEKVDIKWYLPDKTRVVQVKSSKNKFRKTDAEKWCRELVNLSEADEYELRLVGPYSRFFNREQELLGVWIPTPSILDLETMLRSIAHQIDVYADQRDIPLVDPIMREIVTRALLGQFQLFSTQGKKVERYYFDGLLAKWLLQAIPRLRGKLPDISTEELWSIVKSNPYLIESWWQVLQLRRLSDDRLPDTAVLERLLKKNSRRVILVGQRGGGKTAVMKMAAHSFHRDTSRVCVWIPLKDYTDSIDNTLRRFLGWYELPVERVFPTLEEHKVILLLDGLDEVAESVREKCSSEIEQLLQSYRGRMCVSYTTTDHSYFKFEYPLYEVEKLNEGQINKAINQFFGDKGVAGRADHFVQRMQSVAREEGLDLNPLMEIPINLAFLLELGTAKNFTLTTIRDLHGQVVEKRLRETEQRGKRGKVHVDTKVQSLIELAFRGIIDGRGLRVTMAYVKEVFSVFFDGPTLSDAVREVIRSGLLIKIDDRVLEWPHPSFRDYLAGRRLFELAEIGQSFEEFPFGTFEAIEAVSHGVRLSSNPPASVEVPNPIFGSLLEHKSIFSAVKAAAAEFSISNELCDSSNFETAKEEYQRLRWGERFLDAYQLLAKMAKREQFLAISDLPIPTGLTVYFNDLGDFCAILFSDEGMAIRHIDELDSEGRRLLTKPQPVQGFCMFAPFFCLLAPEIVAYIEVGVWLRLLASKQDTRLADWHQGLSSLILTPNDWTSWSNISELPELPTTWRGAWKRELLSWHEFYVPVTFQIARNGIKETMKPVPTRLSEIRYVQPPTHHISLAMIMPFNTKIELGNAIFIPSIVSWLNRYYFLYSTHVEMSYGDTLAFAHLRG